MTPPKDALGLRRIGHLTTEIPRAGRHELALYQQERDAHRESFVLYSFVAVLMSSGALLMNCGALGVYLLYAASCFGLSSAVVLVRLAMSRGTWRALPEGASEAAASLEDALTKSLREWNVDVTIWNDSLAALDAEIIAWRSKLEDPACREDGWSEISHGLEGEALFTRGRNLVLERRRLYVRRQKIHHAILRLRDAMRPVKPESQASDPEPENG